MKKALLLFLFFASFLQATSQKKTLVQLKRELAEHIKRDAQRVDNLLELTFSAFTPVKEKIKFTQEALAISQELNYQYGEAYALANTALYRSYEGNMTDADSTLKQAYSMAEKIGNPELTGIVLYKMGSRKTSVGNKEGLDELFQAEKIFEVSKNYIKLSRCQTTIANFYQVNLSNYPVAMEYIIKASASAEKADFSESFYYVWTAAGSLYSLVGDYDMALVNFNKAEETIKEMGVNITPTFLSNAKGEIYRLTGKYAEAIHAYNKALATDNSVINAQVYESNLADVYVRLNNLPMAFQYGFSALARSKQLNDIYILPWVDGVLARAYLKKGDPDSSIYHAQEGLVISTQAGTIEFMRDNALALADAYSFKKDFSRAYKYHLQYINYRDSMLNTEVKNKTAVLKHNNEMQKKQAEITQLSQKQKAQRDFLISALIVLVLILVTAGLLLRTNRQKHKANRLLHKQKQEIDQKAKDLEQAYNNVELLGEIGRKITSSLSLETIISTVYDNVNSMMDASVFGIGIYHEETRQIDFPATYENGVALPAYSNSIYEQNRFASLCFISGKEIVMGDLETDYKNYLQEVPVPKQGQQPVSLIYLPLKLKERMFGVITIQSFQKNAYSEYHLYMLRTIAIYAAIALENAESYKKLNQTVESLRKTQTQLIQSEKMASLGELTAGIAHEIQNPLNFVNNFSEVNVELIEEVKEYLSAGDLQLANETFENIKHNLEKIRLHGKRADSIVKGMLQHSQSSTGARESIDINALTGEYLRLAYHGLRAKDKSFNAVTKTSFDNSIDKVSVIPQDMGRVLLNLINNAYYTVTEKKKQIQNGYEPTVTVSTERNNGAIKIKVKDNGNGIPQKIMDKIFQPFFTTKPTGQGTGLGLSLAYDIVTKGHDGELKVETKEGEGSEFIIQLPDRLN
ncbi:MAG TPA: ATP-binding protein [Chitinophagaceae bacterium]|nr:ATP-binding protein [Chitinophagaceae bacterium]